MRATYQLGGVFVAGALALCSAALAQTETEPNNTIADANGPYQNALYVSATLTSISDVDYFRVELTQPGSVRFFIHNGTPGQCPGNSQFDPTLTLYDANGTQIGFNDDGAFGLCPQLDSSNTPLLANLPAGTYYVKAGLLTGSPQVTYVLQAEIMRPVIESFTYQGRLDSDGAAFSGNKQVTFSLWTDQESTSLGSRIGLPLQYQALEFNKGLFTADLEFTLPQQPPAFNGTERYLQIEIAEVGGANPVVLSPRTRVNLAPMSSYALRAGEAKKAAEAVKAQSADFAAGANTAFSASFADNASTANAVPWSGVSGKPAGFADNIDNTAAWSENSGVTYTGNQVGINTGLVNGFDLAVSGTAAKTGGGSWSVYSDARLKHDVTPLKGTLDRLLQLRGYSFEYNADAVERNLALPGTQLGLLAQEVQRVFPDWVETDKNGYLFVTERATTALMVEALRDLRSEKDAQLDELRKAKDAEIADLKARLERIEKAIEARR
jgi:hypothetical protein